MTKSDFVSLLADGIQLHEGWAVENPSYLNLNPGNLVYTQQLTAVSSGGNHNFAKFRSYYDGRTALERDIAAKIDGGHDTKGA